MDKKCNSKGSIELYLDKKNKILPKSKSKKNDVKSSKSVDNPKEKDLYTIIKNGARRCFEKLKGKNVLVILDNPWAPFDPSLCSLRPFSFGFKDSKCDYLYSDSTNVNYAKQHQQAILEVAKEYSNVRVFDLKNLFLLAM